MLINKPVSNGDIVSIKLVNGDEIIAKLEESTGDSITINKPLAITIGPHGLGMMPWLFLGDKESMSISKSHFFTMVPSKSEAAKQYMEGTTGLTLAK